MNVTQRLIIVACAGAALACAGPRDANDANTLRLTAITGGNGFTCGIHTDSTAWCWGANQYGQLGTASSGDTCKLDAVATGSCGVRPIAVSGSGKFTAIDAGE